MPSQWLWLFSPLRCTSLISFLRAVPCISFHSSSLLDFWLILTLGKDYSLCFDQCFFTMLHFLIKGLVKCTKWKDDGSIDGIEDKKMDSLHNLIILLTILPLLLLHAGEYTVYFIHLTFLNLYHSTWKHTILFAYQSCSNDHSSLIQFKCLVLKCPPQTLCVHFYWICFKSSLWKLVCMSKTTQWKLVYSWPLWGGYWKKSQQEANDLSALAKLHTQFIC